MSDREVIVTLGDRQTVVELAPREIIVETGLRGPPGPSDLEQGRAVAAEELPSGGLVGLDVAGRAVRADAARLIPAIGITREALEIGAMATIVQIGRVNGFTGLTPGQPCWLGAAGALTQAPPTSGLTQEIGVALTADTILLDLHLPILHG
jgi:hypothetical protein